ncbi:GNAT family N-acetyltransferase [Paucihalobacter ruber]|nr:N-acetyltransferase family protein [Paucihalobacter ruber]
MKKVQDINTLAVIVKIDTIETNDIKNPEMKINFRPMTADDWTNVAEIYRQGIETGNATFQQEIPTWDDWNNGHIKSCRIVAVIENEIVGWAALTAVSARCVYAGVAEVSVYISHKYRGEKIGTKLLDKLISESENEKLWTLQAGIFPENIASLKIHEELGFRKIGHREKIGKMNGNWRDTVLLERRSKVIGID